MSTVLLYAPALAHTFENHPENHLRLDGLLPFLDKAGVLADVRHVESALASTEQLTRVHDPALLQAIHAASLDGGRPLDADTYTTYESYDLARVAAGSCCVAVDQIMSGEVVNGIALVRPPGHHATRSRPGGFCLLNNVAVAARHAQAVYDVERVMIVDFDVHHGNGTQDVFYEDGTVLFISLHLYHPYFYPGTGSIQEVGRGPGKGLTLNVPFPPYVGDRGYKHAFAQLVQPIARRFEPDLLLASVGFDAHWSDPLASAVLSLSGYADISQTLVELASELCTGHLLFVLEGGYRLHALRYGVLNVLYALLQRDTVADPLGPAPQPEVDVTNLLNDLQALHLLN